MARGGLLDSVSGHGRGTVSSTIGVKSGPNDITQLSIYIYDCTAF